MEDTITYVDEPEHFEAHLDDLDRLRRLDPARILPSHGAPDVIAAGGYSSDLISATQQYIGVLKRCRKASRRFRSANLRELIAGPLDAGWIHYFPAYGGHSPRRISRACWPRGRSRSLLEPKAGLRRQRSGFTSPANPRPGRLQRGGQLSARQERGSGGVHHPGARGKPSSAYAWGLQPHRKAPGPQPPTEPPGLPAPPLLAPRPFGGGGLRRPERLPIRSGSAPRVRWLKGKPSSHLATVCDLGPRDRFLLEGGAAALLLHRAKR